MTTASRHNSVLDALIRDYADIGTRSRMGLKIATNEGADTYTVSVVGVIRSKRILVLTAPITEDGALVAVMSGQAIHCSWFSSTTAFRFRARVVRILFEPVPLIHIELPAVVEKRKVRSVPRALTNLRATIKAEKETAAAIVDVSTRGARVAVHSDVRLQRDDAVVVRARLPLLDKRFDLIAPCKVIAGFGHTDPRHPEAQFFGFQFGELDDSTLLLLHAFVQECLVFEIDLLAQLLYLSSKEVDDVE